MPALTDADLEALRIERLWWQYPGRKEAEVRERLGLSMTAYTQRLVALVYTEAALAADPLTCKRLQRIIESRKRTRGVRAADPGCMRGTTVDRRG